MGKKEGGAPSVPGPAGVHPAAHPAAPGAWNLSLSIHINNNTITVGKYCRGSREACIYLMSPCALTCPKTRTMEIKAATASRHPSQPSLTDRSVWIGGEVDLRRVSGVRLGPCLRTVCSHGLPSKSECLTKTHYCSTP